MFSFQIIHLAIVLCAKVKGDVGGQKGGQTRGQ